MAFDTQLDNPNRSSDELIYEIARQAYQAQLSERESYRAQSGTLLAFAGVITGLSVAGESVVGRSPWMGAGVLLLVAAAALFFAVIAWFSLEVTPRLRPLYENYVATDVGETRLHLAGSFVEVVEANEKTLERVYFVHTLGAMMLLMGTVIVGVRMALMVV